MEIDYSPLNDKNPELVESPLTDMPKLAGKNVAAMFLTIFLLGFLLFVNTAIQIPPYIIILSPVLIPVLFFSLRRMTGNSSDSTIKLSNFAVKNGWHYEYGMKGDKALKIVLKGVVSGDSGEAVVSNIIYGDYKDFQFQIFNPYGRGLYTFMKVRLKNKYPHIVLDSRANNPFFSNIGHFFSEESRISLEGDFDKFFKAYAKAPAVDTLRILSPDMMRRMIDSGHKYDIEIFEDYLHIISNYKYANEADVRYFFELADTLLDKLDRRRVTQGAQFDHQAKVT